MRGATLPVPLPADSYIDSRRRRPHHFHNDRSWLSTSVCAAPRPIDATVTVPGSKSITNRALIAAALADGSSELVGALHSDDTRYMAAALNALGVIVESNEAKASFRIEGGGGTFTAPEADLFVGNSGTTMRFLTAVSARTWPLPD